MVVIWNAAHLSDTDKRQASVLAEFAAAGGKVVVLGTRHWDWTQLCDIAASETRGSRAFAYESATHPMLSGIPADWLIRWNSRPGTVAVGNLEGPALTQAKKILWVRDPETCVAAELPVATGSGTLLFCQLDVQRRVNGSEPTYDPVAERVLINILGGTLP